MLFESHQFRGFIDRRTFSNAEILVAVVVVANVCLLPIINCWAVVYELLDVKPTSRVIYRSVGFYASPVRFRWRAARANGA